MMYDVLIIGAGQAGLSMGYFLKQSHLSFLTIDKEQEIGDVWRKRYDSLVLFTPKRYSSLPGLMMEGNVDEFPKRDEVVEYLKKYATTYSLPIKHGTEVISVEKTKNIFHVVTNRGELLAKQIVVATGPFQTPKIPEISQNLDKSIKQLHSSQYKNSNQLQDGAVLVIGGGNSGTQIAVELSKTREVYLSISQKLKFLPLTFASKSIFWWFDKLGILHANRDSFIAKKLQQQGDPVVGYELKESIQKGNVSLKPRTRNAEHSTIYFEDGDTIKVKNIIWATGFCLDYQWIKIKEAFDMQGNPKHKRGVTSVSGLYFLGLPWQHRRGSALLLGVGNDAKYLFQQIIENFEKSV